MIFVMGVTMLKMDRAKAKWRVKLQRAFAGHGKPPSVHFKMKLQYLTSHLCTSLASKGARTGKYVLFVLPLITVLREGM